jgi:hypothetical protein
MAMLHHRRSVMSLYQGQRIDGVCLVTQDGHPLSPRWSLTIRNHSPAGFNWGHEGSGPAQLALAILLEETTVQEAQHLYQWFKRAAIARIATDKWSMMSESIQVLLARLRAEHPEEPVEEEEVLDEA